MRYLLDTHTLIWATTKAPSLSKIAWSILSSAEHAFFVSAATTWEIATKYRLGKLPEISPLLVPDSDRFEEQLEQAGFTILPITSQHTRFAGSFPAKHGDPFDRMLAAQAFLENLTLLSNDPQLDHFHIHRVW